MTITKAEGYCTPDGKMFATLDEAAGHSYGKRIQEITGQVHFGAKTIIKYSREIAQVLADYNAELDRLERGK